MANYIRRNKENIIVLVIMFLIASIFMMQSQMHPLINGETYTDSSVFRLIGILMKKGYIPYRDTFDHKGPLLYLINYLGVLISEANGIWYIELIFLTITLFSMYKIANLVCNKLIAVAVVFISTYPLITFFQAGNLVEEYALPFISISLYIYLDYLLNNRISKPRLFICGLFLGAVLMLRPNMIGTWIVLSIGVLIKLIKNKEYNRIFLFLLWFCLGVATATLPFLIWLLINDAFKAFILDYIVFNIYYSASGNADILDKLNSFWFFIKEPIILTSFVYMTLMLYKKNFNNVIYLILMIVNTILLSISGELPHYGMIIIPLLSFPLANIFKSIDISNLRDMSLTSVLMVVALITTLSYIDIIRNNININGKQTENKGLLEIKEIVNKYTNKNETITCYGNWDYIYYYCDRIPASKHSYQTPPADIYPIFWDEYYEDLNNTKPNVLILCKEPDNRMWDYLKNNAYFEIELTNNTRNVRIFVK